MEVEGGCYCGAVRYSAQGDPVFRAQCHCRECQYISGGGANLALGMPEDGFRITRGEPSSFARDDLENPISRLFCGKCGTHLASVPPGGRKLVILKVGTLDDPALFEMPQIAIWTVEKQAFHMIPEGLAMFDGFPPRK